MRLFDTEQIKTIDDLYVFWVKQSFTHMQRKDVFAKLGSNKIDLLSLGYLIINKIRELRKSTNVKHLSLDYKLLSTYKIKRFQNIINLINVFNHYYNMAEVYRKLKKDV